jgi:hypothetical protein
LFLLKTNHTVLQLFVRFCTIFNTCNPIPRHTPPTPLGLGLAHHTLWTEPQLVESDCKSKLRSSKSQYVSGGSSAWGLDVVEGGAGAHNAEPFSATRTKLSDFWTGFSFPSHSSTLLDILGICRVISNFLASLLHGYFVTSSLYSIQLHVHSVLVLSASHFEVHFFH